MSMPASHQSPVVLQRQHTTRHQYQRQPPTPRSPLPPPSRSGDTGASNRFVQDDERSRLVNTSAPASSHRPSHSRNTSAMSDNIVAGANGTTNHAPAHPDESASHMHHQQRPRKTSIHGSSGTWNLGKTIGAGSMGKVKLARKGDGSEQVAVKIVPRQLIQDRGTDPATGQAYPPRHDDSKEIRTTREAAIVTLLDHPYICGMRDVIKTSNHWYMLCEYVNGGQMLDYIISHGRLKEKQARKFGRQIVSALDYCHRNSIVHRDLKIENILISKTGDIKIIDFGLSNLFSPRAHLKTFCGSLYFAAPELLQAKQYIGPEVDVWSFGIVLYVLVCGKVPFDDQNMPALHAKIKRGLVDYPQWLSADCKNLLSRMLVTDPRNRASLNEIMMHPWLLKGYSGPPENFLPPREPLTKPLDPAVIEGMTGFEFGPPDVIAAQLTKVIESEEYRESVKHVQRETPLISPNPERKKPFGFDFYKRRSSSSSKDTLTNPSAEILTPYTTTDPINAYNPLISVYYLVQEKQERERRKAAGGGPLTASNIDQLPRLSVPKQPEAAHTSETSYELRGETAAASSRTRPRARTHGDDEVSEVTKIKPASIPPSSMEPPPKAEPPIRKDLSVGGMLRRLSTRRHHSHRSEAAKIQPPTLSLQAPDQAPINMPRKSLSIRRTKESPPATADDAIRKPGLLTPPASADGLVVQRSSKPLGRSTSVSEVDWRKKHTRPRNSMDPPGTSGSDHSTPGVGEGSLATRARSVGHAKREAVQTRRSNRADGKSGLSNSERAPANETLDTSTPAGNSTTPSSDFVKPVFLKGLFSVSTTSTKPPIEIRRDIIRVLTQLGVSYNEIKGGFACVHRPSIDLKSVVDGGGTQHPEATNMVTPHSHRPRLSFGGNNNGSGVQSSSKNTSRRHRADTSYTNSDASNESVQDGVLGNSLILQFEIYIVKVPLLALHGIQFKSVNKTNTWQYKSLASRILSELKL